MQIVGLVAEYNPFHLGHRHHLNKIKADLNPDGIICVMSGNFVQRGEPAVFDKWSRAEMALQGGVDLVLELPTCFATATAEIFAESSVRLLHETQVVKGLSFGIEEYHKTELVTLCKLLSDEPQPLKESIKTFLKKGFSFPTAREKAVIQYVSKYKTGCDISLIQKLIKKPNFILALEYMKAINRLQTSFFIFPVLRKGPEYYDKNAVNGYLSATAIRNVLMQDEQIRIKALRGLPNFSLDIIEREISLKKGPVFFKDFEDILLYILRRTPTKDLVSFFDVEEGLENRIKKASLISSSLEQLVSTIKSKRYPETKINRILTHILINIRKDLVSSRKPLYFRVLGISSKGAEILKQIKHRSSLPILSRASDCKALTGSAKQMLNTDLLASDVYSLAYKDTIRRKGGTDIIKKLIYYNPSR
jgi:predicted nucleotidyltransferase